MPLCVYSLKHNNVKSGKHGEKIKLQIISAYMSNQTLAHRWIFAFTICYRAIPVFKNLKNKRRLSDMSTLNMPESRVDIFANYFTV